MKSLLAAHATRNANVVNIPDTIKTDDVTDLPPPSRSILPFKLSFKRVLIIIIVILLIIILYFKMTCCADGKCCPFGQECSRGVCNPIGALSTYTSPLPASTCSGLCGCKADTDCAFGFSCCGGFCCQQGYCDATDQTCYGSMFNRNTNFNTVPPKLRDECTPGYYEGLYPQYGETCSRDTDCNASGSGQLYQCCGGSCCPVIQNESFCVDAGYNSTTDYANGYCVLPYYTINGNGNVVPNARECYTDGTVSDYGKAFNAECFIDPQTIYPNLNQSCVNDSDCGQGYTCSVFQNSDTSYSNVCCPTDPGYYFDGKNGWCVPPFFYINSSNTALVRNSLMCNAGNDSKKLVDAFNNQGLLNDSLINFVVGKLNNCPTNDIFHENTSECCHADPTHASCNNGKLPGQVSYCDLIYVVRQYDTFATNSGCFGVYNGDSLNLGTGGPDPSYLFNRKREVVLLKSNMDIPGPNYNTIKIVYPGDYMILFYHGGFCQNDVIYLKNPRMSVQFSVTHQSGETKLLWTASKISGADFRVYNFQAGDIISTKAAIDRSYNYQLQVINLNNQDLINIFNIQNNFPNSTAILNTLQNYTPSTQCKKLT